MSRSCSEISFWTPEDGFWGTLVIDLSTIEESLDVFERVWESGVAEPAHRYSFPTYESMHKVLAPNRMAIIRMMMGSGPLSIREIARRAGRDFKGVHTDVTTLVKNGLLYKAEGGSVVFPYDRIHFDFEAGAADQSAA